MGSGGGVGLAIIAPSIAQALNYILLSGFSIGHISPYLLFSVSHTEQSLYVQSSPMWTGPKSSGPEHEGVSFIQINIKLPLPVAERTVLQNNSP